MTDNPNNQEIKEKFSNAENDEIKKIIDRYYISKGYVKTNNKWINPKTGNAPKKVNPNNQYSKIFKKFWNKDIKDGNTTLYWDKEKVLNPTTGRFVKKKNVKKEEGTEIFQNKVLKTDAYLINTIQPQIQNAMESGNKTEINIETGKFGNIKKLLDILPFGEKKLYFLNEDGTIYFLNAENLKRIADIQDKYTTGIEIVSVSGTRDSDMEYVIDTIYQNKGFKLVIDNFKNPVIDGSYFPYTHNINGLDLERYHIYRNLDDESAKELHDKNCLLHAIESAGYNITSLKFLVKNQSVPMRSMGQVADLLNIHIHIRRFGDDSNLRKFGTKTTPNILQLGLIKDHYFLIEPTKYTSYSIKNYFDIPNKDDKNIDWNRIYRMKGTSYEKTDSRFISSYDLVKLLVSLEDTHLTKLNITNPIFHTKFYDKINVYDDLEYDMNIKESSDDTGNLKLNKLRTLPSQNEECILKGVEYFDFETTTARNDGTKTTHKPYLINNHIHKGKWIGEDCGKLYLDYVVETYGTDYADKDSVEKLMKGKITTKLIAHNAGYDFRFIQEHLYRLETLEKGNGIFTATGLYYSRGKGYMDKTNPKWVWVPASAKKVVRVEIVDSLKMINMGLGKFNKTFDLGEVKKEIMPYDLYTEGNVNKRYLSRKYVENWLRTKSNYSDQDKKIFWDNCSKWGCIGIREKLQTGKSERAIDIIKYSSEYCYMDCITLKAGYEKFREMTIDACQLDIMDFVSLASLADFYLKREGCYDGVLQMSGVVRSFIQECVVGGRTMVKQNSKYLSDGTGEIDTGKMSMEQKKNIVKQRLADFDGVSLYPSAMNRMEGFLKGKPKIIKNFEPEKYDGYFIKIKITDVGKWYNFPLISFKDENGVRQFTNDCVGREIFVDKTYLEDIVNFQQVKYEFIQGYYFDEGRNPKINSVIQHLFNTRLHYKKLKNPIQMIFKELMNSSYGKSYLKPIDTETEYIKKDEGEKYIDRNYNYIKEFITLPNGNFKVKKIKTINDHFNNAQVGVEILSMSKRIMNEVMCSAEDLGIDMYITDTDSIHMDSSKINYLGEQFKIKYNRELIGKQLGQFHTDFDVAGADTDDIEAIKSVFLGKKCYYDLLYTKNTDGTEIYDEHVRMKGVPNDAIIHRANEGIWSYKYSVEVDGETIIYENENDFKNSVHKDIKDYKQIKNKLLVDFKGNLFELYKYLYEGNEVSFNLVANRPKFQFNKDMTIESKSKFDRKLRFPDKEMTGFEDTYEI